MFNAALPKAARCLNREQGSRYPIAGPCPRAGQRQQAIEGALGWMVPVIVTVPSIVLLLFSLRMAPSVPRPSPRLL